MITRAQYTNEDHSAATVVTTEEGAVSISPLDRPDLWQELKAWGTPEPYTPPVVTVVTQRQARLALLQAGLLDQVTTAVAQAGGATQITWDYATEITRDDPMVANIATALGLTNEQIDNLFKTASTL